MYAVTQELFRTAYSFEVTCTLKMICSLDKGYISRGHKHLQVLKRCPNNNQGILAMSEPDLNVSRSVLFNIKSAEGSGLQFLIGRSSEKDPDRYAQPDNFLFNEKSLSKGHAILCIKRLTCVGNEISTPFIDQFRISVEDLGSTHGIVDLHSQDADAKVIDLKNGERFGLVKLSRPVGPGQSRGAKLKFRVLIKRGFSDQEEVCELSLINVTNEESPCFSRSSTLEKGRLEAPSSPSPLSTSSSEMNYSEDLVLEIEENDKLEADIDYEQASEESEMGVAVSHLVTHNDSHFSAIITENETAADGTLSPCDDEYDDFSDDTYELLTEFNHKMENTPECYDCCESRISFKNDAEGSMCGSDVRQPLMQFGRKRSLEESIISEVDEPQTKKTDIGLSNDNISSIKKRQVLIGGLLGFVAGSLGTLGVLVGIANME